jgi:hypothetical protein
MMGVGRAPAAVEEPPVTDPPKPSPPEPKPEYGTADSILFQAWLVLFLMVVCFALVNYLLSYMPR